MDGYLTPEAKRFVIERVFKGDKYAELFGRDDFELT